MNYDMDKASELALTLLFLTMHDKSDFDGSYRAWKGINFDVMNHLYEKGLILDPANKKQIGGRYSRRSKTGRRIIQQVAQKIEVRIAYNAQLRGEQRLHPT